MSQPLGIRESDVPAYLGRLFANHDFRITLDVLQLDHTPIQSVQPTALDGQVNLQRDSAVCRTATFTFDDPDHSLHFDSDSPWQGAVFSDRMIRVRHHVTVPGVGTVVATPFIGPITKVARDGDTLAVECQDKAALALTGGPPVKVRKGMNAVAAIRYIMTNACGEDHFRLPSGINRNIQKPGGYSTGWHEDASPWLVCQRIANQLNMQLLYSCDGFLTLRRWPSVVSVTATGASLTAAPQVDFDSTEVSNMVRVTGTQAPPRKRTTKKAAKPQLEHPPTTLSAVAVAAPGHPLAPVKLGRNGVPRYLPTIIEGSVYKSLAQARTLAAETLTKSLLLTTGVTFDMIPVFHLDTGDLIVAQTDKGRVMVRLQEGSIPLAASGEMSVGTQKRVSRGPRKARMTAHARKHAATKAQRKDYRKALHDWNQSKKAAAKHPHGGRHG